MLPAAPAELVVPLLAFGLYLQDSLVPLLGNQAMLSRRGRRHRVRFASERFRFGRRDLYLPNPLTPWVPEFRLAWFGEPASGSARNGAPERLKALEQAIAPIAWGLPAVALVLFGGLPLALHYSLGWAIVLPMLALALAGAGVSLAALWRARTRLGLNTRGFLRIAFESLVCLPCALNLVRKAALGCRLAEDDLVAVGQTLLAAPDYLRMTAQIAGRVDAELEATEPGTPGHAQLTRFRASLAEPPR